MQKIICLFCLIIFTSIAFCQIESGRRFLNDTTQLSRRDSLRILRDTAKVWYLDLPFYNLTNKFHFNLEDTTLDKVRIYRPSIQKYGMDVSLGNLGTAIHPFTYQSYRTDNFELGMNTFDPYFYRFNKTRFYKTLRPYSRISYVLGTQSEQKLQLLHTQRILLNWQAGIEFTHINSSGSYQRQEAFYNNFRFFSRFRTKDKRYTMLLTYIHNDLRVQENGGLVNDSNFILSSLFSNGNAIRNTNRGTYPVRLDSAENRWYSNAVQLNHAFVIPRKSNPATDTTAYLPGADTINTQLFTLKHTFLFKAAEKRYRDGQPLNNYQMPELYDSTLTRHSVFFENIVNDLRAIFFLRKKYSSGSPVYAGIFHQYVQVNNTVNFNQGDTIEPAIIKRDYTTNNIAVYGGIRLDLTKHFGFHGTAKFFLSGYNQADLLAHFEVFYNSTQQAKTHHKITAYANYRLKAPDYIAQYYYTNYYQWENAFGKTQLISAGLEYSVPEWQLLFNFRTDLTSNFIYFDVNAKPAQNSGSAVVFYARLQKTFNLGKFHFQHDLIGQYSSANLIRVPYFTGHINYYFQSNLFKDNLLLRAGFDVYYNTPFQANAYAPLSAQFYLQNSITTGNYPFVDLYISGRIETFEIFFRVRNINQRIPSVPYFITPHYPMQHRSFQFGVTWAFYN